MPVVLEDVYFPSTNEDIEFLGFHGFTGTPGSLNPAAYELNKRGFTCSTPLMLGHRSYEDMKKYSYVHWQQRAIKACEDLKSEGCHKKIIAFGYSVGSHLAMKLAAENMVDAVIIMSAPIFLQKRYARMVNGLPPQARRRISIPTPKNNLALEQRIRDEIFIDRVPLEGIAQLTRLVAHGKKNLHRIKVPICIFQGNLDQVVQPPSGEYVYDHVGSKQKELVMMPEWDHFPTDEQQEWAVGYALEFFEYLGVLPS